MSRANIASAFTRSYGWFTSLGLSKEHIGMVLVILISTYHVVIHMQVVEGWTAIALVMGGVLGYLNAIFAIQLFEAQDETRRPALWGLILSMVVSIYMQYSFYDNNPLLTPYRPLLGFNLSAFLSGSWAPLFEFILGSMYGVRMRVKHGQDSIIAQVVEQWQAKLDELSAQFSALLKENQTTLAHNVDLRAELRFSQERIAQLNEQLGNIKTERAVLNAQLNSAQVEHRHPAPTASIQPTQSNGRLSTVERRQKISRMNESGELDQHSVTSLGKFLGAAPNTLRSDLGFLKISLSSQQQKLQA